MPARVTLPVAMAEPMWTEVTASQERFDSKEQVMSKPLCVIVGSGEGLGRALAAKFATCGFDLALISRSEKNSAVVIDAVAQINGASRARFFCADVTQPETLELAIGTITREMGEIDLLIYNVRGSFADCEPLELSYDALETVYRQEVIGAFAAAKAVLPGMISRSRGSIFFSSATAALRGSGTHPLYAIGKFGLRALSQSLSKAYARHGIHIVHFRLDCDLDTPIMQERYDQEYDPTKLASPDAVAQSYWLTYQQPRSAWSNEVELRPYTEAWTY
ncbi:MAG: short-chain dehydrogenase [Acidiferrobacteraceae bacterium]|nr:short-chain dehydrogenase [Acidiferrobacteraceae bacterium]